MRSLFDEGGSRLQFAGHETFPLRYGWLKKAFDAVEACDDEDRRGVFASDRAVPDFGVGKNMVASMRHWALASGLLRTDDDRSGGPGYEVTEVGRVLMEGDPYLEHPGSLWLIHWSLASKPGRAAAWYFAFNEFNEPVFTRDLMLQRLARRRDELKDAGRLRETRITETTLKRDVECLVRTYAVRGAAGGKQSFEDGGLESPLTELALVQSHDQGGFQFRRGQKATLPDEVFAFALIGFWRDFYPTRREFSLEGLTHEPGSPGRVFLLDDEAVAERLLRIERLTRGALRWDESSGLRQVYALDLWAPVLTDLLRGMYEAISEKVAR